MIDNLSMLHARRTRSRWRSRSTWFARKSRSLNLFKIKSIEYFLQVPTVRQADRVQHQMLRVYLNEFLNRRLVCHVHRVRAVCPVIQDFQASNVIII